jgi:hypothetical protein
MAVKGNIGLWVCSTICVFIKKREKNKLILMNFK